MRNSNLDCARGIAATIVVFYHIPFFFNNKSDDTSNLILQIILFPSRFGEQAVYFFMLLSGYVLALAHSSNFKLRNYLNWVIWRSTRLLIVYYFALLIANLTPDKKELRIVDFTHIYIFKNETIYSGINPPLWSLSVEFILSCSLFYLLGNNSIKSKRAFIFLTILLYGFSYLTDIWGLKEIGRAHV